MSDTDIEPRITEDRYHLAKTEKQLRNAKTRPYSVAFKLRKKPRSGRVMLRAEPSSPPP